jgi:hypothetical protein
VSNVLEHGSRNLCRHSTPLFGKALDHLESLPGNARVNWHPLATLYSFGHWPCLRLIAFNKANRDNSSNALSFVLVFAS